MDQSVFPEELLKSHAVQGRSRLERWLGISNPAEKPDREAVPGPVPVGTDVHPDRSRIERWLGVSNPAGKPNHEAAPAPVPVGTDIDPDPARLERWLGVDAPDDRRTGPMPSAEPRHRRESSGVQFGTPAVGVRRYGGAAVAVLTAAIVGLGALAVDLRADVSSLQKDGAADAAAHSEVVRQLNETAGELRLIDARLADAENSGSELDAIRTRLANLEKRLGRR